ncbi:Phosphoglycerate kinase [Desulfamplus magnetovallimortis]|uniref:Phosphoglycerate kinase n=1 Tax=Desulfamplus magnetovallimortis TaxID=1246637 RepID=A0A1W1H5P7_9BACT|nr:phosphoglycerate kinase [Desulfamplus magnetovallimortis]SLM27803.1 Phosphoglycerate kinase [Desulfamplus magnetovallimortis]
MQSVRSLDVSGRQVMVRVDYNIPMDGDGRITDDNRIKATLPLLEYLIEQKAKVILISHMGNPGGKAISALSLAPAATRLSELLKRKVEFAEDCLGSKTSDKISLMSGGDVILLENLRFHDGEKSNDPHFAEQLASLCEIYINDAFSVSHRKHASVVALPSLVKDSAAGFLLEKEMQCYHDAMHNPGRPLVAVIGGAKVSSKLEALYNMLNHVDVMLIGGAMANTFVKSLGVGTGDSMVENDLLETAQNIIQQANKKGVSLFLPVDFVVADSFDKDAEKKVVKLNHEKMNQFVSINIDNVDQKKTDKFDHKKTDKFDQKKIEKFDNKNFGISAQSSESTVDELNHNGLPDGWMVMDIGPETASIFADEIAKALTIVWNGPMGVFEMERFCDGTRIVANAIGAAEKAFSIVGGGDTGLAAKVCDVADKISYISTGGGAFLHLMEGKELPGVAALNKVS